MKFIFNGTIYRTIFENEETILGIDNANQTRLFRKDQPGLKFLGASEPVKTLTAADTGKLVRITRGESAGRVVSLTEWMQGSPLVGRDSAFVNIAFGVKMTVPLDELEWAE
jgi:hypothetical protein